MIVVTKREYTLAALLLAGVFAACGGGDAPRPADDTTAREAALVQTLGDTTGSREVELQYAPELQVDLMNMAHMPSGLYMKDIAVGTGDRVALNGSLLRVHYTGWFPNGVEFDSSRDENEPIEFTMGQGEVLRGWEEALTGMRTGGRRLIVLPPALAFGAGGLPGVIPENATLVFDLELVEIVQ
jgi:FKBP-type peptidyl-prolyl cis-trans isomerase